MAVPTNIEYYSIQLTVRLVQGYRYLDKCGESLVRLEEKLHPHWLPAETTPASGSLRNDTLGMVANFNSESLTVRQDEFFDLSLFSDQTCKIFETLYRTFEVKHINVPVLRVIYQKGFEEEQLDEAEAYLIGLGLIYPDRDFLGSLQGTLNAINFTFITVDSVPSANGLLNIRRRFNASVVRQEKQLPFDARIVQRASLWSPKQREALSGIKWLRQRHPTILPVAVQFDMEHSFDQEFKSEEFDMFDFIQVATGWAASVKAALLSRQGSNR